MRKLQLLPCLVIITLFIMTDWCYGATFVVDSLGDVDDNNPYTEADGTNTLRKCIRLASQTPGADTINFGVSGTISPTSSLPAMFDDGTVIDASSQWDGTWPEGQPGVTLDGSSAGNTDGLWILGVDNCRILGLFIKSFEADGIHVSFGGQSNNIGGTGEGERNIISGNGRNGIGIDGVGTDNNVVSGNYIGTDANGTADLGNSRIGVQIWSGAQFNTIGGTTSGERNIISGNDMRGIEISDSDTNNNVVSGNYIGTDVNGTADLGNSGQGVRIASGARSNTVGGAASGERNIISGNDGDGVWIGGSGTDNNVVSGNYIGTDVNGTADLGNSSAGVSMAAGAQSNTIGGATSGERNIISGNDGRGVWINNVGADSNVVSGNYIGTDVNGTADLGNSASGVYINLGARGNTIGGTTPGERNIISGNDGAGVEIALSDTDSNVVSGNYIGTDVNGTADLGNSSSGVAIGNGASNIIGGTTPGERNIISGNDVNGVTITGSGANSNVVSGNYIGTGVNGAADLGNSLNGVVIKSGAQFNTIGGTTSGERNIISGNDGNGVLIGPSGADSNVISGNYIGTDVNGTAGLGNSTSGVRIYWGAQSNTIGGTTPEERNIISGNGGHGVWIDGTDSNVVSGNYIGTDMNGTTELGNSYHGVYIASDAQSNTIGGDTPGERNIISGNDVNGVTISGSGTDSNVVSGNYIGTDVNGTADLGNGSTGISIHNKAQHNVVGGPGNIIAFSNGDGVKVSGTDTKYNRISHNSIHDNAGLGIELVNNGNDEIPAPVITLGELTGNTLTVSGNGAGANATVEVFAADSAGSGEGKAYLGSLIADGSGDFSGQIDVTGKGLSPGDPIVATTTHTDNNTSEFSVPVALTVLQFITVTSPNGGETLCGGTTHSITWQIEGTGTDHIEIQYSTDSGVIYQDIAEVTAQDDSYIWAVPPIESSTARVKAIARDAGDGLLGEDESDADFTIQLPQIGATPTSLAFSAEGADPADKTLSITNPACGTLDWSIDIDYNSNGVSAIDSSILWLSCTPTSGDTTDETDEVVVSVDITGLSGGVHEATITVSATVASNTPQTIPVTLDLVLQGQDMEPGWNLISFPWQPVDTSIESALSSIANKYDSVWRYDSNPGWLWYLADNQGASNLWEIESGIGYWVLINESCTLVIQGTQPSTAIPLVVGWNLVGFSSQTSRPIEECMSSILGKYKSVWGYDPNPGWRWYLPANQGASNLLSMEPGKGYWIEVTEVCTWNINAGN